MAQLEILQGTEDIMTVVAPQLAYSERGSIITHFECILCMLAVGIRASCPLSRVPMVPSRVLPNAFQMPRTAVAYGAAIFHAHPISELTNLHQCLT